MSEDDHPQQRWYLTIDARGREVYSRDPWDVQKPISVIAVVPETMLIEARAHAEALAEALEAIHFVNPPDALRAYRRAW